MCPYTVCCLTSFPTDNPVTACDRPDNPLVLPANYSSLNRAKQISCLCSATRLQLHHNQQFCHSSDSQCTNVIPAVWPPHNDELAETLPHLASLDAVLVCVLPPHCATGRTGSRMSTRQGSGLCEGPLALHRERGMSHSKSH